MASTTNKISCGFTSFLMFFSSFISSSSICKRPAVSNKITSFSLEIATFNACFAICTTSLDPFAGKADGKSFALAHNGVLWNDRTLKLTENLSQTSIETDSYVAVQLIEKQNALDFNSLKTMAETVEGSFVFIVLDSEDSIWFVVGDNPLCLFYYEGFLLYASTEKILCNAASKLHLSAPVSVQQPEEGEILKIDRSGQVTTGSFIPRMIYPHWWRYRPYYGSFLLDEDEQKSIYGDLFNAAKSMGISEDEIQALLDYGCAPDEIEELLYDPALLHEMTGELLYAY